VGSIAFLLSSELATLLSGRYIENFNIALSVQRIFNSTTD